MHEVEIDSDATGDSRSAYGARALPLQVYGRVTAVRLSALARAHTPTACRKVLLYVVVDLQLYSCTRVVFFSHHTSTHITIL